MNAWLEWINANPSILWWLATTSALMFIAGLILVPIAVGQIPKDYFAHKHRLRSAWDDQHLVIRALVVAVKNALGIVLLVMGLALLVLPGQGITTILVGIMLMNFPGKFRLERWLASRRPVRRSIDWLRRRAGRDPLVFDECEV